MTRTEKIGVLVVTACFVAGALVSSASAGARAQAGISPNETLPPGFQEVLGFFHYEAGAQTFAEVSCPRNRVVYGGGAIVPGPSLNSSYPDGDTAWAIFVDSVDRAGDGAVYAICAKRNAKWSIQEIPFDNPAGTQTHQEVPCPAGAKVVGGGAYGSDADVGAQSINSTYPRQVRKSYYWEINMNNADSTDQTGIAIAICGSAGGYLIKHERATNEAGTQTLIEQRCGPRGTQVPLGGGVQSSSTSTSVYLTMDGPETRGGVPDQWWTKEANGSSEDAIQTGWVICVGTP